MELFIQFVQEAYFLFVVFFGIAGTLIYIIVTESFSGFKTIDTKEAIRMFNNDAFFIDTRVQKEYEQGHIPGAINLPFISSSSSIAKIPSKKEMNIVVYCISGLTAKRLAKKLAKNGYNKVHNLRGGLAAWTDERLQIESKASIKASKKLPRKNRKKL